MRWETECRGGTQSQDISGWAKASGNTSALGQAAKATGTRGFCGKQLRSQVQCRWCCQSGLHLTKFWQASLACEHLPQRTFDFHILGLLTWDLTKMQGKQSCERSEAPRRNEASPGGVKYQASCNHKCFHLQEHSLVRLGCFYTCQAKFLDLCHRSSRARWASRKILLLLLLLDTSCSRSKRKNAFVLQQVLSTEAYPA